MAGPGLSRYNRGMTDLFEHAKQPEIAQNAPLAERLRPRTLDDFVGQATVAGPESLLRRLLESDQVPSLILWGPPGSGKTTLAMIIAATTSSHFISLSAVTSGVKDLKSVLETARTDQSLHSRRTILFIDEIHRWNKSQQDALLPHVERGTITLIGATTENPSFEINAALLSRCRVFVLEQLETSDIAAILRRALADRERGFGALKIKIADESIEFLAAAANGDARIALNALELAVRGAKSTKRGILTINEATVKAALAKSHHLYDKGGEQHYNIISALHKSLRGSDADAAIYWLGRMLEAGEDPLYIARRLVRFASEDIGLANSRALEQAVAGYQACHFIGLPECNVILAQVVVYLAKCRKSNALYRAYAQVQRDVSETRDEPVPLHLRNAPTKLMQDLDYGKNYKYSPDYDYQEDQEYLPPSLAGRRYLPEDDGALAGRP